MTGYSVNNHARTCPSRVRKRRQHDGASEAVRREGSAPDLSIHPQPQGAELPLHGALDGGGTLSLKTDAQGKVFSTALLRMVLDVADDEARRLGLPGARA